MALFAQGNRTKPVQQTNRSSTNQDAPGTQKPDVVQMVGPVVLNQDLRRSSLCRAEGGIRRESPDALSARDTADGATRSRTSASPWLQKLIKNLWRPTPTMPGPLLTFEGGAAAQFCACAPPDSDGDVGPNHYVEAINSAFRVFDKIGHHAWPARLPTIRSLPP